MAVIICCLRSGPGKEAIPEVGCLGASLPPRSSPSGMTMDKSKLIQKTKLISILSDAFAAPKAITVTEQGHKLSNERRNLLVTAVSSPALSRKQRGMRSNSRWAKSMVRKSSQNCRRSETMFSSCQTNILFLMLHNQKVRCSTWKWKQIILDIFLRWYLEIISNPFEVSNKKIQLTYPVPLKFLSLLLWDSTVSWKGLQSGKVVYD